MRRIHLIRDLSKETCQEAISASTFICAVIG